MVNISELVQAVNATLDGGVHGTEAIDADGRDPALAVFYSKHARG